MPLRARSALQRVAGLVACCAGLEVLTVAALGTRGGFSCDGPAALWSADQAAACSPYDCSEEAGWAERWSDEKKAWCCMNTSRGCVVDPFDCNFAYAEHTKYWSDAKRAWCCAAQGRACTVGSARQGDVDARATTTTRMRDPLGLAVPLGAQEVRSVAAVTGPTVVGTAAAKPTKRAYDCFGTTSGWDSAQKEWCCSNMRLGCPKPDNGSAAGHIIAGVAADIASAKPKYDCFGSDGTTWGRSQQEWCCYTMSKGCELMRPAKPAAGAAPSDDLSPLDVKWYDLKPTAEPEQGFNCDAGVGMWQQGWSDAKKKWCCDHGRHGCEDKSKTPAATSTAGKDVAEYKKDATTSTSSEEVCVDTVSGWADLRGLDCGVYEAQRLCTRAGRAGAGWDAKLWGSIEAWGAHGASASQVCCVCGGGRRETRRKSQSESSTKAKGADKTKKFDCANAASSWATEWPEPKRDWCCSHAKVGCDPYNCTMGLKTADEWPEAKRGWCCRMRSLGCMKAGSNRTAGSALFDCSAGHSRRHDGWSEKKRAWCCKEEGKGCDSKPRGRFDCSAVRRDDWSHEKKMWCCKEEGKGCHVEKRMGDASPWGNVQEWTGTALEAAMKYECSPGLGDWEKLWTPAQREYCCKTKGVTCEAREARLTTDPPKETTRKPTDFLPAAATRAPTATVVGYDCQEDYHTWTRSWSFAKMEYCCSHTGRGCVGDEYDCFGPTIDEELHQDWVHSWPDKHRTWCCSMKHVGCKDGATVQVQAKYDGLVGASAGVASGQLALLLLFMAAAGASVLAAAATGRRRYHSIGGRTFSAFSRRTPLMEAPEVSEAAEAEMCEAVEI